MPCMSGAENWLQMQTVLALYPELAILGIIWASDCLSHPTGIINFGVKWCILLIILSGSRATENSH